MPGIKRKASFASSCDRPSKIVKRTTSETISRKLPAINKKTTVRRLPLKFPSLKAIKTSEVIEVTASEPLADIPSSLPPTLRRASTLTLDEDADKGGSSTKTSFTKMPSKKPTSLSKKSSSFVEAGALVTRLSGLASGSIVGETSMAVSVSAELNTSKTDSRKSLSICSKDAAGTSSDPIIAPIDEAELPLALESLKSTLSKENSITNFQNQTNVDTEEDTGARAARALHLPPGGLIEVAISFDTTGSMYGVLDQVRAKVQDLVQRLQADIPGIRIAIIAHGDYCDEISTYVVKWIDFGASLPEICDFVKQAERTGGGDGPECYELVLLRTREVLSWTPGSQRILIMIYDNLPHEPGYKYGGKRYDIDWRVECAALRDMSVKIYGVEAGQHISDTVKKFSNKMAEITGGRRLSLENFSNIFDMLMMICYREGNPDMLPIYEQEVRDRNSGNMASELVALTTSVSHSAKPKAGTKKTKEKATRGVGRTTKAKGLAGTDTARPLASNLKVKKRADVRTSKSKNTPKKMSDKKGLNGSKVKTAKSKVKESNLRSVQKREKVPDIFMTKGPMSTLKWSKWTLGIQPSLSEKNSKTHKKSRIFSGYIPKKTLFDKTESAIYEFAVQCPGSQKKHVVYYWISKNGFLRRRPLFSYLLNHRTVRNEVENVLKQCCMIYVRRGVASKSILNVREYIRDNLDYAWRKYTWRKFGGKQTHRLVQVLNKGNTLTISDDRV